MEYLTVPESMKRFGFLQKAEDYLKEDMSLSLYVQEN